MLKSLCMWILGSKLDLHALFVGMFWLRRVNLHLSNASFVIDLSFPIVVEPGRCKTLCAMLFQRPVLFMGACIHICLLRVLIRLLRSQQRSQFIFREIFEC